MTTFRYALTDVLYEHQKDDATHVAACEEDDFPRYLGVDAILAMPEMQAIRQALLTFAANVEEDWGLFSVEAALRVVDGCCLPPHVVDWLME